LSIFILYRIVMKLRIDDFRFPPDDTWEDEFRWSLQHYWIEVATECFFIELMRNFSNITEISFDHDLWDESDITGYELLRITLDLYKACRRCLPKISIHSANPVWVDRMKSLLMYYDV